MNKDRLVELWKKTNDPSSSASVLDWYLADAFEEIPNHRIIDVGWDYSWFRKEDETRLRKAVDSEGRQISTWSPLPRSRNYRSCLDAIKAKWPNAAVQLLVNGDNIVITRIQTPDIFLPDALPMNKIYVEETGPSSADPVGVLFKAFVIALMQSEEMI